ncbi:MAG: hypothetical protein KM310_11850 [Clostridiales bacterium]|nr:hypothetical protein [Clostridiales bacterium]
MRVGRCSWAKERRDPRGIRLAVELLVDFSYGRRHALMARRSRRVKPS